jgi:hypothetical protein
MTEPNPELRRRWAAHQDAWLHGELSQRDYCRVHGLCRKGFARWRRRLKDEAELLERRALRRTHRKDLKIPEKRTPEESRIRRAR